MTWRWLRRPRRQPSISRCAVLCPLSRQAGKAIHVTMWPPACPPFSHVPSVSRDGTGRLENSPPPPPCAQHFTCGPSACLLCLRCCWRAPPAQARSTSLCAPPPAPATAAVPAPVRPCRAAAHTLPLPRVSNLRIHHRHHAREQGAPPMRMWGSTAAAAPAAAAPFSRRPAAR